MEPDAAQPTPAEPADGSSPAEEETDAKGCGGCCFAILLLLVGVFLGYLDDRAQRNKDVYFAERGQTFKIDLLSDLETAKGLSRLHDLRAVLRLEGLPEREVPCSSIGDSDFSELKEIESVSYKGVPLNSINVDCTHKLAVEIPDDAALDDALGHLVFSGRVQYYYVDFGDRVVGSATGSVPIEEKSTELEHSVPLHVVAKGAKPKQDRPLKTASGIVILLAVLLALVSGVIFVISALRQPDPPEKAEPAAESPPEA